MKQKATAILLLFAYAALSAAPSAYAKSENASPKAAAVMPALPVQGMQGHESAKKAIEQAEFDASFKGQVVATTNQAAAAMRQLLKRAEVGPGDPKTTFTRSENRMHSPRFAPKTVEAVAGWTPTAENTDPVTGNLVVQYEPPPDSTSAADYIVVEYSPAGEPVKATSFTTVVSSTMPDMSSMTLVLTDVLASGEVIETYGYPVVGEDLSGVTKWTVLFYDADGNFSKAIGTQLDTLIL
jgi:hypothetical protein